MEFKKVLLKSFLCCLLVLFLVSSGCTSSGGSETIPDTGSASGGISGTYTSVEDPANSFLLKSDGKVQFKNAAGGFSGIYTTENSNIRICYEESDGTSCITAPMEADGSFVYGLNTYRK